MTKNITITYFESLESGNLNITLGISSASDGVGWDDHAVLTIGGGSDSNNSSSLVGKLMPNRVEEMDTRVLTLLTTV